MAFSGKITISGQQSNFVSAFSEFIRFICGDTSVAGRDWSFVSTQLDTTSGNFSSIAYSGTLNVTQNNVWMDLPTAFVTDYTFTRGGNNLVENTDYNLDWRLGRIRFLTGSPPYTVNYSYNFKRFRIVVRNTGLSDDENIYAGFLMVSSGFDRANIITRGFTYFDADGDFFNVTTYGSPRTTNNQYPCFGFWTGAIDMWIFSNRQRIIVVARNNTYYTFCYVGNIFRFGLPSEYTKPLWVQTDLWTTPDLNTTHSVFFDSTNTSRRFLIYPFANTSGYIIGVSGAWTGSFSMVPTQNNTDMWQTVAYVSGFRRVLLPTYILSSNMLIGTPDNVYFIPGFALSAESRFQVGSDYYIVFPNCFRTGYADFLAIKEE